MTTKIFVLDTNVLLTDPLALGRFGRHQIVVPITVIEELDKFKRDLSDLGRNAREVTRRLDRYREEGSLARGVPTNERGGLLRVWTDLGREPPLPFPTLLKKGDSLILASALLLKKREELPVVFVSRDINLRLRADAVGLTAQNYEEDGETGGRSIEELYSGLVEVELEEDAIENYRNEGAFHQPESSPLQANQCVIFKSRDSPDQEELGRYLPHTNEVRPIVDAQERLMGIRARNTEQRFAVDLLLDDRVKIVTLAGKAGTGKTLLAIAAGLRKVAEEHEYSKLVVARPIMPLGKELGFLPGEIGEKLRPWMEPVFDNLELILKTYRESVRGESNDEEDDQRRGRQRKKSSADEEFLQQHLEHIMSKHRHKARDAGSDDDLRAGAKPKGRRRSKKQQHDFDVGAMLDGGMLEVQPLTYVRGRSLPGQFLIIDEAQNLTHHEVKTIVTRAGEGTKVVLTGDPYQIDNPFLDSVSCGLAIVVEKLKGQPLAGHITLTRGERSELAEMASNLL